MKTYNQMDVELDVIMNNIDFYRSHDFVNEANKTKEHLRIQKDINAMCDFPVLFFSQYNWDKFNDCVREGNEFGIY